jgi:hypothetical protein
MRVVISCPRCTGTGNESRLGSLWWRTCGDCNGSGSAWATADGPQTETVTLPREVVRNAVEVLRRGVDGLSTGACYTCGAEPGCNIDCAGCRWVCDAEWALAALEPYTKGGGG